MTSRPLSQRIAGRLKHYRTRWRQTSRRVAFATERTLHRRDSYSYDAERHKLYLDPGRTLHVPRASTFGVDHLLHPSAATHQHSPAEVPAQIFVAWTGGNPMSENRTRALTQLRERADGIPVHLVTPRTIDDYVLPGHPLHQAYEHLSLVHRSDYLRAYLLRHHGGIYMDLKPVIGQPRDLLLRLTSDNSLWAVGAQEIGPDNLASNPFGPLGRDERVYFDRILQQALLACRPDTPLVVEWFREVERRLDYFADLLEEYPAKTPRGIEENYPVPWHALLAEVLAPLCLKHAAHIETLPSITFDFSAEYY